MDLLLQLSIFLMLGSLGLLLTFTIFLCVFRLCFCGGQSRFTPRNQRSNGDMLDHLLDEETGEMEESDISENHPRPTFWRLPWLKGDKVSCSSSSEEPCLKKTKPDTTQCDQLQHELKCTRRAEETIRHM